ncbi:hypothetical protein N644_0844 [Lactiplantibacillus paraplantarum]|nr:hypothetical protein N644_0844 [Lactiplantibacillus paraplantarum]
MINSTWIGGYVNVLNQKLATSQTSYSFIRAIVNVVMIGNHLST